MRLRTTVRFQPLRSISERSNPLATPNSFPLSCHQVATRKSSSYAELFNRLDHIECLPIDELRLTLDQLNIRVPFSQHIQSTHQHLRHQRWILATLERIARNVPKAPQSQLSQQDLIVSCRLLSCLTIPLGTSLKEPLPVEMSVRCRNIESVWASCRSWPHSENTLDRFRGASSKIASSAMSAYRNRWNPLDILRIGRYDGFHAAIENFSDNNIPDVHVSEFLHAANQLFLGFDFRRIQLFINYKSDRAAQNDPTGTSQEEWARVILWLLRVSLKKVVLIIRAGNAEAEPLIYPYMHSLCSRHGMHYFPNFSIWISELEEILGGELSPIQQYVLQATAGALSRYESPAQGNEHLWDCTVERFGLVWVLQHISWTGWRPNCTTLEWFGQLQDANRFLGKVRAMDPARRARIGNCMVYDLQDLETIAEEEMSLAAGLIKEFFNDPDMELDLG